MAILETQIMPIEQEGRTFELLPVGYYKAQAVDEEVKSTKAGTGSYLKFEFQLTAPAKFEGQRIWENYNIINPNADAQRIAHQQLGNLAWAIGHQGALSDSAVLLNKPVTLEIGIEPAKGDYAAKNKIKAYWPAGWSETEIEGHKKAKKGGSASSAAPAASTAPVGARPWAKK